MIGRLLQSAASSFTQPASARPQPVLESVTEETHTRELLYPDIQSLRSSFHDLALGPARPTTARDAANYDDRGALDIAYPGDVRVLIAQDAHSRHHQPQMLYDSRPVRATSPSSPSDADPGSAQRPPLRTNKSLTSPTVTPRHRHTPSGSLFSARSPTSPQSPGDKSRFSFGDARARTYPYEQGTGDNETAQGRLAREAKEDVDALLGCMFGAPGFRLEPGTKLHILPRKVADGDALGGKKGSGASRPISSGGFQRKRTPLVRSTSAADVFGGLNASATEAHEPRAASVKPAIMFTRLFTVSVSESAPTDTGDDAEASGFKGATAPEEANGHPRASAQVKQKKVPMYAVAVILQLPIESLQRTRATPSPQGLSPSGSSLNDSTPATSWRGEQSAFASFMEIQSQGGLDTALNSHIPHVLQHWNVVNRTLELLELCAKNKLAVLLDQADPLPQLTPNPSPRPGLGKVKKLKPQNQQSVYVMPGCLQADEVVKKSVETASQRVVGALRTRRVVIGQGRWGAWREEARWVGRWAGGKEQNFFLYNFLTSFLGCHTEWLELLAPKWYRRRYAIKQRMHGSDDHASLTHRTVIVSTDKMAARRLIFLLAAFLPSHLNHYQIPVSAREPPHFAYSESPPQAVSRRDSEPRRTRAPKSSLGRRSGNETSGHMRSVSFSVAGEGPEDVIVEDAQRSRARRDSDARSLRNTSLVAPGDGASRKASMSTVTADTVQAVPHFSNLSHEEPSSPVAERKRPGSGGSMASFVLNHTLKRSESAAGSTAGSTGRWGSVVSGFWSSRRDSSTDDSDVFASSQESPRRTNGPSYGHRRSGSGLERMVEEADILRHSPVQPSLLSGSPRRPLQLEECLKPRHPALQESGSAARNIPRPRKPERLPLKLSFNEDEGYLDIAMDKDHSNSSLASSFTSIRHPLAAPLPAIADEHISPYGSIASDSPQPFPRVESALNVAGWLKTYQPDFVLQAVRAYDDLESEIEASMVAEAALIRAGIGAEQQDRASGWREISTTLVADTSRFTVERIRLLRRSRASTPRSPKSPTFARPPDFETRLLREPVMDLDATLTDAVERILALSLSGPASRASSPPRQATGPRPVPGAAASGARPDPASATETPHSESRRAILGALEDVARSVASERDRYRAHQRRRQPTAPAGPPGEHRGDGGRAGADGEDNAPHLLPISGESEHVPIPPQAQAQAQTQAHVQAQVGREPARDTAGETMAHDDMDGTLREGVRRWMRAVETW